jgi:phage terminase large subunit GpA-like protein
VWEVLAGAADPGERLPPAAWAEGRIYLSQRVTPFWGPLSLDHSPYLRGLLDAFVCPQYREYWHVLAAQVGKSTLEKILIGYLIDQDPGPAMIVYPDMHDAKRKSRKHLQTVVRDTPALARHLTGRAADIQNFELTLEPMTLLVGWAGSATVLSGEPIRYPIGDEAAKWVQRDKSEAHPVVLLKRRANFYGELAKLVFVTTPNLEENHGWKDLLQSTWHEHWVPCPACGDPKRVADVPGLVTDPTVDVAELTGALRGAGYQVMEWEQITGWGKERNPDRVRELAYYECPYCKARIDDKARKEAMIPLGKWVPRYPDRRVFGSHLPSWYSLRVNVGEVAERFYRSLGDPGDMQDWTNSDRCRPWVEMGTQRSEEEIRGHNGGYPGRVAPYRPLAVALAADVGDDEIWYVVVGFGLQEAVAVMDHGMLPRLKREQDPEEDAPDESLNVLDRVLQRTYRDAAGLEYGIDVAAVDAGYDTAAVYDFCRRRPNCFPVMGADNQKVPLQFSRPETIALANGTKRPDPRSVYLMTLSTRFFRDLLAAKQAVRMEDPGAFWISSEAAADEEFVHHLTGEIKVREKDHRGRLRWTWKRVHANHYNDCLVYALGLARFLGVRDMTYEELDAAAEQGRDAAKAAGAVEGRSSNWVTMGR